MPTVGGAGMVARMVARMESGGSAAAQEGRAMPEVPATAPALAVRPVGGGPQKEAEAVVDDAADDAVLDRVACQARHRVRQEAPLCRQEV